MKVNVIRVLKLINVVVVIKLKNSVDNVIILIIMMLSVGVRYFGCIQLNMCFGNILLCFIIYSRCDMLVCEVRLEVNVFINVVQRKIDWKSLLLMYSVILGSVVFGFLKWLILGKNSCIKNDVVIKIMLLQIVVRKMVFGIMCVVFGVFFESVVIVLKLRKEKQIIVVLVIIGIRCVFLLING